MENNEFAQSLMIESRSDLDAAETLFSAENYSRSIFHCQQCIEKLMKSGLMLQGYGPIYEHKVSTAFAVEVLSRMEENGAGKIRPIVEFASYLEDKFTKTRYPYYSKGEIVTPSKRFKKQDAETILNETKKAHSTLLGILKKKFGV